MQSQDAMTKFMIALNTAMDGENTDKFSFSFCDRDGKYVEALLSTNKRTNSDGVITGVFCFLQIASSELQQVKQTSLPRGCLYDESYPRPDRMKIAHYSESFA